MEINTSYLKNPGIYILTNTINNKQYVGLDSNIPRRFKQHLRGIGTGAVLHEALSTVGLENWTVQFIPYPGISREALRAVEQWYICKLGAKHPDGYNMRGGSKARVRERRKAGALLETIADEFGLSISTVSRWCQDITEATEMRNYAQKTQVRERRKAGALLETIAAEFDMAVRTVSEWCKDIKVEKETVRGTAAKRRVEKKALKQQALEMKKSGMKQKDIAADLGVNIATISRWLN